MNTTDPEPAFTRDVPLTRMSLFLVMTETRLANSALLAESDAGSSDCVAMVVGTYLFLNHMIADLASGNRADSEAKMEFRPPGVPARLSASMTGSPAASRSDGGSLASKSDATSVSGRMEAEGRQMTTCPPVRSHLTAARNKTGLGVRHVPYTPHTQ